MLISIMQGIIIGFFFTSVLCTFGAKREGGWIGSLITAIVLFIMFIITYTL